MALDVDLVRSMLASGTTTVERQRRQYTRRLVLTDTLVVIVAVFGAHLLRYGFSNEPLTIGDRILDFEIGYFVTSVLFVVGWLFALQIFGTRDASVLDGGTAEYRRILDATMRVFGVLAILALLFQIQFG